jgi:aspartyl-tRNA(Asn)/glutamyl-tRNA(Gln) amidotransferase subunit B
MPVQDWKPVIGLEIHCQLKTKTKMFTSCGYRAGEDPNTQTDAYTLGLPGTLPRPNKTAVEYGLRLGLALECELHKESRFARKHYFYPDLPKGYQITQSDHPYATGGTVRFPDPTDHGKALTVRLVRIHFEEDAGKNLHLVGDDVSLVDYNRAGAPLLEIVSEPDIRSAAEASAYMRELRTVIRYLDISDANMEEGTMRCDANVSIRRDDDAPYGTRCEIKNLNSFKFLEQAINAEIRRQVDLLEGGGTVIQSTMSYDPGRDQTKVMRTKEEAADYRYFPEPDMPPLEISQAWIDSVRATLPELPHARRERYGALGLSIYDAGVLTAEGALADFFDAVLAAKAPAKKACNWVTVELLGRLNGDQRSIEQSPVSPEHVAELIGLIDGGTISGRSAKEVFDKVYAESMSPRAIVERDGYAQVSDAGALDAAIDEVLAAHPKQLEQYAGGKVALKGFFVGQVMKKTRGQANPQMVQELLAAKLPPVDAS